MFRTVYVKALKDCVIHTKDRVTKEMLDPLGCDILFSRKLESEERCDDAYHGPIELEDPGDLTKVIDSLHLIKFNVDSSHIYYKPGYRSITKCIARIIANKHFSPLSNGMDVSMAIAIQMIAIKNKNFNVLELAYPGAGTGTDHIGRKWYTISDFLSDVVYGVDIEYFYNVAVRFPDIKKILSENME